jgi:tetratricopeptide (TPR) repeat protein
MREDVDLDEEARREVLDRHRSLDQLDHYAQLGVAHDADRKIVKRAYFDLAARFHPDRYFRKRLGSFKTRMEVIFGRITLAHDTLTSPEKRADYDAYLDEQRRARGIEDLMADALAEVARAKEAVEREVGEAAAATAAATPAGKTSGTQIAVTPSAAPPTTATPTPPGESRSSSASRPIDPAVRREALARKLLGGRAPPPGFTPPGGTRTSVPAPSVPPAQPTAADAMDALRRRYEQRKEHAQGAQAQKYVGNAEAALAKGDVVTAANNFRVAMSLVPGDADLARRAKAVREQADAVLAQTYRKQGDYEEKTGQWPEAARSWTRVARARPDDADAHDRAAGALVKGGGDLHEASRLAERACVLEPANAAFRVTLGSVFLAANLPLKARRELETAAQLAPQDDTIAAMLKRVSK